MVISSVIKKGFYTLSKEASILDAISLMAKNQDGFVVFIDDDEKVVGVLTERDLVSYLLESNHETTKAFYYAKKDVITFKENRNIEYVLISLIEFEIRRVIVVDKQNRFLGVTTQEHIIRYIDNDAYKVKMKLSNLTNLSKIISRDELTTINEILLCMKTKNIGSVVITNKENELLGIITERDIIRIMEQNIDVKEPIHKVMSKPVIFTDMEDTVENALNKMQNNNIQRIIVKDDDEYRVLGIRDILHIIKGNYGTLLEKKLKQSKTILNSITEAIIEVCMIEDEYIINWSNQKASEIFDKNIIDKSICSVLSKSKWEEILENLTEEQSFEQKISLGNSYYKLKVIKDVNSLNTPIRLIFIDVTQIEELNQNLQQKVEEKTKELALINENLEKRIQGELEKNKKIQEQLFESRKMDALAEMISNISHHWRQPLTTISTGATGIQLQSELGILEDEFLGATCKTINDSAQYLSRTMDEFAAIINGTKEETSFDLKTDTNIFLNQINSTIEQYNIDVFLDLQEHIHVKGYPTQLIRCFINIFDNAKEVLLKNNIAGNRYIFIEESKSDDMMVIKFRDNGGGIDESIISKIFEPYFTTKHQYLGTGMGLHLVYNIIVNSFKGKVEAKNVEFLVKGQMQKGAEIILTIPFE